MIIVAKELTLIRVAGRGKVESITTSNYTVKTLKTSKGVRKQAVAEKNGKKYFRFIKG